MLKTLFSPLTAAGKTGTTIRDIVMVVGAILAMLGTLGILSPEQIDTVKAHIATMTSPPMLAAIGTIMTVGVSIYRNITKAVSAKALDAAKEIDAKLPKGEDVEIVTPGSAPNIIVPAKE